MRILYGVQGTGNGHITRARLLSAALKQRGIELDVLLSGRVGALPEVAEFGDYRVLRGISFYHRGGKIDRWKTLKNLSLKQFKQDVARLDLSAYDLLINDFEPVSAWAAKQQGLKSLSLSHQAAFLYDIPSKHMNYWNQWLIRYFAPCEYNLGVHWCDHQQAIIPPIVEPLTNLSNNGHILVYLPFESLAQIKLLLRRFSAYRFVCFHPDISQVHHDENIELQPIARQTFLFHLSSCAGVFCNAGFELPSEAMAAGKKLLVKPLMGQFEQQSNAYTLQALSLAQVTDSLDPYQLHAWLQQEQAEPVHYPNVAAILAEKIESGEWINMSAMASAMWRQVSYPTISQQLMANIVQDKAASEHTLSKIKVWG